MHEATLHDNNSFITLTYADEHLPYDEGLFHRHVQLFLKRLRYELKMPLRYYMCGEYGENFTQRPHYHLIVFGYMPEDRTPYGVSKTGRTLTTSPTVERLWQKGNVDVSDVTNEACEYVARYIMKKQLGREADYTWLTQHGAVVERKPEYTAMSRNPGIAKKWFDKYHSDIFPHDELLISTKKGIRYAKIPRYYDTLMDELNPEIMETIREKRKTEAYENYQNHNDARLDARRVITERTLAKLKREL